MGPSPTPHAPLTPQTGGSKSPPLKLQPNRRPQIEHIMWGWSSGLITIVEMTLFSLVCQRFSSKYCKIVFLKYRQRLKEYECIVRMCKSKLLSIVMATKTVLTRTQIVNINTVTMTKYWLHQGPIIKVNSKPK